MPPLERIECERRGNAHLQRKENSSSPPSAAKGKMLNIPITKEKKEEQIANNYHETSSDKQSPQLKRRGRSRGNNSGVQRQRSSSLSDMTSRRGYVGGREAAEEQLPVEGAFMSLRARYLEAMKGSNEKGIFSRAEQAMVGQIEEEMLETVVKPRRRTVQRTRSRSLTMLDSGRLSRRGARNPTKTSVKVKKEEPKRPSVVKQEQTQQQPQQPTRGRARRRTVARSRSKSLTTSGSNSKKEEEQTNASGKRSFRLKPAQTKSKPQRMRSRSLTAIKDEATSTRNLISMFERGNSNGVVQRNFSIHKPAQTKRKPQRMRSQSLTSIKRETKTDAVEILKPCEGKKEEEQTKMVVKRNFRFHKPPQTKRKPQRMRSRSLTSIKRETGADGITKSYLEYTNPNKWISLKTRSTTKLQTMVRGYLGRLHWILRKPQLQKHKIRREKMVELQTIQKKKDDVMWAFRHELEDKERARKKQVKALIKEKASLEKQIEAEKKAKENWRHEIRKEKEQAIRLAETKKVDNVVTMLNSSAVTGFENEQKGAKKRIKVYQKEIDAKKRELERTQRSWDYEKELKQEVDLCIRSIVETLREGLGADDEFVGFIAKYSGVKV